MATAARPLEGLRHWCIDRAARSTAKLLDVGLAPQPRFLVLVRLPRRRRVVAGRVAHHPRRDAIGLLLVAVVGRAEHQLGLYDRRGLLVGGLAGVAHELLHVAVAVLSLQLEQHVAGAGKPAAAGLV